MRVLKYASLVMSAKSKPYGPIVGPFVSEHHHLVYYEIT
jgi:hypothetical protein